MRRALGTTPPWLRARARPGGPTREPGDRVGFSAMRIGRHPCDGGLWRATHVALQSTRARAPHAISHRLPCPSRLPTPPHARIRWGWARRTAPTSRGRQFDVVRQAGARRVIARGNRPALQLTEECRAHGGRKVALRQHVVGSQLGVHALHEPGKVGSHLLDRHTTVERRRGYRQWPRARYGGAGSRLDARAGRPGRAP